MNKNNLFFADWISPFKNWWMETHANAYIEHMKKDIKTFSFELSGLDDSYIKNIISKYNLWDIDFSLPFNSISDFNILNNIISEYSPEFVFFNSLYWVKVIEDLKSFNSKVKFILRSWGNDISQSNIQNYPNLDDRRNFVVSAINNAIDLLIVNSEYTKNKFLEYGIRDEKMKIVIGWVDTSYFSPIWIEQKNKLRESLNISKWLNVGISVSRLVEFKNIWAVLEIAKNVVENPNNIFIIVWDGPFLNFAKDFVKLNKLENKIYILWDIPTKEIAKYYQIADYFLQMSTYSDISVSSSKPEWESYIHTETMWRSAIEAMSCGLAIVATNVWWVSEVVRDWWILIKDNDISNAVKSILEIEKNDNLKKKLWNRARHIALSEYGWNNVFSNYNF